MRDFIVPEKCIGCPVIDGIDKTIASIEAKKQVLNEIGESMLDGIPSEVRESIVVHIQKDHSSELTDTDAEDVLRQLEDSSRTELVNKIDAVDAEISASKELKREKIENCTGKLTLRAVRNDAEYLVTICASRAFSTKRENPAPAIVRIRNNL